MRITTLRAAALLATVCVSLASCDQIPGLGPVLVEYGTGKTEFLRPQPRALKVIVGDWEIAKYGSLQR